MGDEDEIPQEDVSLLPEEQQNLEESQEFLVPESESPSEFLEENTGSELLSVDELLSAAVIGDGEISDEMLLDAPSSAAPTFQLRFSQITEEQKVRLRKALEAVGITVAEKTWSATTPLVSQLSEYQAIYLLQVLRGLGVQAQGIVFLPGSAGPTQEDLALGDLSSVPEEAHVPFVESAPSVLLPKGEKDVLLSSPNTLPNVNILESFGLVIAHRSIARRMFREEEVQEKLERELKSVPNRNNTPLASSHLQQVLRDLLLDLRKSALSKGGNAVLGVKIESFTESSHSDPLLEQLRLVAFGTVAVVEKT